MFRLTKSLACLSVILLVMFGETSSRHHSRHDGSANHMTPRHQEACSEPSDLRQRLDELYTGHMPGQLHETFYMLPFLREAADNQTRRFHFSMEHLDRSRVFSGSSECPKNNNNKDDDDDNDIAVAGGDPCPVYHTINTDRNRFPRALLEAQCRCSRCRGVPRQSRAVIPACEGVYYYVRVLRRTSVCVGGVYQYAPVWEKLQIGCACRFVPRT